MTALEDMLIAAADDGSREPAFTEALMASQVFVLGEVEGDQMALATWGDDTGDIVPFFTSEEMVGMSVAQLPDLQPDVLVMDCRELFALVDDTRLVLNPHGPVARIYETGEVAALLAGVDPTNGYEVSYDNVELEVSPPSPDPVELKAALSGLFAQRPAIQGAHLAWVTRSDGQAGYLLFVLAGDADGALAGLQDLDIGGLLNGATFDVTAIPSGVDDHLLSDIPPFYVKPVVGDVLPQ